jgi:hypothetical protein
MAIKMRDFIERLRAKPEHIRHRIALGTTAGITGVVTCAWLFAIVVSGDLTLAVPSSSNANLGTVSGNAPVTGITTAVAQTKTSFTQLLGAVGVATATTAPASLSIIDDATTTPQEQAAENANANPTVIPF